MSKDDPTIEKQLGDATSEQPHGPTDGGYGWVVCVCIAACNAVTWGQNMTYGVYISFFVEGGYYAGGTVLGYAFVGGLSVSSALLCAPLATYLTARFGIKIPLSIGASCVALGQIFAGMCKEFAAYAVCQGRIFGIGLGMIMVPCQPLPAQWFRRHIGVAQGTSVAGAGIGGLILANTTRAMIQCLGLKYTYLVNGCISAAVLVPAIFFLRDRKPGDDKREPVRIRWSRHAAFFWFLVWGCLSLMAYFIALYTLASYASDGLGLTQQQGAALQSILAAGMIIGRPLTGQILDLGGKINMSMLTMFIAGLSCVALWLPAQSFTGLAAFVVVQGISGGTIWSAVMPCAAAVVRSEDLEAAMAVFWLINAIPVAFAKVSAVGLLEYSRLHLRRTGAEAYHISIGFCGGLYILGALVLYGAKVHVQQGRWTVMQKT